MVCPVMMPDEKIEESVMMVISKHINKNNLPFNKALGISLISSGRYIDATRVYRLHNLKDEKSGESMNYVYILVDVIDINKPKIFARTKVVNDSLFGEWALKSNMWEWWNKRTRSMKKEITSWN